MNLQGALLPLPAREHAQLGRRTPLAAVICQVQFVPTKPVGDPSVAARFQQGIRERYPKSGPLPALPLQLVPAPTVQQPVGFAVQWQFADAEDNWHVVLADGSLALETRRYSRFGEFVRRMQEVVEVLTEQLAPGPIVRLGLRYINEIHRNSVAWEQVICPELLGAALDPVLGSSIVQASGQLLLQVGESLSLQARHGWFPQGTTVRVQSPGDTSFDTPFYLLDFDAFETFTGTAASVLTFPDAADRLQTYHENIYRLFRWAVTDSYVDELAEEA